MITIRQAEVADAQTVRELFWDYLQWANDNLDQEFGIRFDIAEMLEDDMATLGKFMPPKGQLLLAFDEDAAAGCICMRTIGPGIGELKRMYVRPAHRRTGIGRLLTERVIADLRQSDYTVLRLDSAQFMNEAHALYRSMGFEQRDEYPESEIPEQFREHWVFMERAV